MRKKFALVSILVVVALAMICPWRLSSHRVVPFGGECGDPTNPNSCTPNPCTCSQGSCHPGGGHTQASTSATLSFLIAPSSDTSNPVTLNNSFLYLPNTTYYITFQLHTDSNMNGFELAVLDANNHQAGALAQTDLVHTYLDSTWGNNIFYMSHQLATNFDDWHFKWTAPSYATGPVTFYFAYNTSDSAAEFINFPNTGVPEGVIYAGTVTISPSSAGIESISGLAELNIYPNPVSDEFGISFSLKESESIGATVYDVEGRLVKTLMNKEMLPSGKINRTFSLDDLPGGIYLMRLNSGEASVTQKIIKL